MLPKVKIILMLKIIWWMEYTSIPYVLSCLKAGQLLTVSNLSVDRGYCGRRVVSAQLTVHDVDGITGIRFFIHSVFQLLNMVAISTFF